MVLRILDLVHELLEASIASLPVAAASGALFSLGGLHYKLKKIEKDRMWAGIG